MQAFCALLHEGCCKGGPKPQPSDTIMNAKNLLKLVLPVAVALSFVSCHHHHHHSHGGYHPAPYAPVYGPHHHHY